MARRKTKRYYQYRHARRRARTRYGVDLTDRDLDEMISEIQAGQAEHVEKQSNRVSVFIVRDKFKVVYDKVRKSIATFLPMDDKFWYDEIGG